MGSINTRARNRSTSTGRRSYSAQTRPIAPASHSRDIEARHSTIWKGGNPINDAECDDTDKCCTDQTTITRSRSQHPTLRLDPTSHKITPRLKTLQIVELGTTPWKYSVVRNVEDSQRTFVREGRLKHYIFFKYE